MFNVCTRLLPLVQTTTIVFPLSQLKLVCHPSVETNSPELIDCLMAEKKRYMLAPRSYGALRPEEALDTADDEENQEPSPTATTPNISLDLALTKRVCFL